MCVCVQQAGTGALQIPLPAQKHAEPDTMGDTTPSNNAKCFIHPQKCPGRRPPLSHCPQPVSRDDRVRWEGLGAPHSLPKGKLKGQSL